MTKTRPRMMDSPALDLSRLRVRLSKPQFELVTTTKQFPALVAGFGSGKTQSLVHRAIRLKATYPKNNIAYYLPTFDLVNEIAMPRFEEILEEMGAGYKSIRSPRPKIMIERGGEIILRTMDKPARIVGYEVADSLIDEFDTLTTDKASDVWKKILARNRQKKPDGSKNTIAVGTTPEGYRFVYEQWEKKPPSAEYIIIKASTYSNRYNLPSDYIQNLIDAYPPELIKAYINGEFTNLKSGTVYKDYDRRLNRTDATIIGPRIENGKSLPGEPLHIGMDFNVTKMAAIVFVNRGNFPHAVAELVDMYDTPAAITTIQNRFPGHPIFVYPDASGGARKSENASSSDIKLLRAAKGFTVCVNPSNPDVKDRILSMSIMLLAGGIRRLKVNDTLCPKFAETLEKQAYDKNGQPDKSSGFDHMNDAAGYMVSYRFPVQGRGISKSLLAGA